MYGISHSYRYILPRTSQAYAGEISLEGILVLSLVPILLVIRLWIGKRLFVTIGRFGVRVSPGRIIKGPCESTELEALEYVAKHTSIPIPKVLGTHRYLGGLYIEMEYIHGVDLQAVWLGGLLSREQKKGIVEELANYVRQLRSLEPPQEGVVGSAHLKECLDHRIGSAPFGPFKNHMAFHSFLRRHVPLENCTEVFGEKITRCYSVNIEAVLLTQISAHEMSW